MTASQLLNPRLKALTISMSMEDAESYFEEAQVFYLPLLTEENEVLGVVSLDTLLTAINENTDKLSALLHEISITIALPDTCHYFELLKYFGTSEIDIIPIVDSENKYIGCVTVHDIIEQASQTLAVQFPGSIIVLEIDTKDYSLVEIMRIVESNGAKVLGIEVIEVSNSGKLLVHLKLNTFVLKSILASFERFNYIVFAHFMRQDIEDDTDERYRHLMKYLDFD